MLTRLTMTAGDDDPTMERAAGVFALLACTTRLKILSALGQSGELSVKEIMEAIHCHQPTTSMALRLLRLAHAVQTRRSGRKALYSIAPGWLPAVEAVLKRLTA